MIYYILPLSINVFRASDSDLYEPSVCVRLRSGILSTEQELMPPLTSCNIGKIAYKLAIYGFTYYAHTRFTFFFFLLIIVDKNWVQPATGA